jgi:dUTP pyrophosphatase
VPAKGKACLSTGLRIAVPAGTYGRVAPRSGLAAKHFIDVGAGVIDEDYRGELKVLLFNHGDADFKGAVLCGWCFCVLDGVGVRGVLRIERAKVSCLQQNNSQKKTLLPTHVKRTVSAGDRIAQLVLERIATPAVTEVASLDDTERGAGGFGSTGGFGGAAAPAPQQ